MPHLPLRLNHARAAGENPRHSLVVQSLSRVAVQVVMRIPVRSRIREHHCPVPMLALLFTPWGWTAGGLVACDDILEMTSEELNELVVLVAREWRLDRELHA